MLLLTFGRHVGAAQRCNDMASPYKSFKKKSCTNLKLIESLCSENSRCKILCLSFPSSGLNLLNDDFGFYFRWCDSEKKLYVFLAYKANMTLQMLQLKRYFLFTVHSIIIGWLSVIWLTCVRFLIVGTYTVPEITSPK